MNSAMKTEPLATGLLHVGLFCFAFFSANSISGAQIALGLALIGLVMNFAGGRLGFRPSPLERPLALLAFAGLLSLCNAVDLRRGIGEMTKFLIILPFWIPYVSKMEKDLQQNILLTFLFSSSLVALISTLRFLVSFHEGLRALGFFSMSLTFGECQALGLVVAIAWLAAGEDNRPRRWFLWLSILLQCCGLVASMARGAIVGLLIGFLYLFWKNLRTFFIGVGSLGLLTLVILILSGALHDWFYLVRPNDWIRLRIWQVGSRLLSTNPVFGVGLNNIKNLYREQATPEEIEKKWVFGHQHNNFMQMLVMLGFFGFTAFFWWLWEMGGFCLALSDGIADPWQKAMASKTFALFLAFWGSGFTEYSFGDEEVAMLFFFLLGLLANPYLAPESTTPKESQENPRPSMAA